LRDALFGSLPEFGDWYRHYPDIDIVRLVVHSQLVSRFVLTF
jgi:hypothetical protein